MQYIIALYPLICVFTYILVDLYDRRQNTASFLLRAQYQDVGKGIIIIIIIMVVSWVNSALYLPGGTHCIYNII